MSAITPNETLWEASVEEHDASVSAGAIATEIDAPGASDPTRTDTTLSNLPVGKGDSELDYFPGNS